MNFQPRYLLGYFIWKSTNTVTKRLKILLILPYVAEQLRVLGFFIAKNNVSETTCLEKWPWKDYFCVSLWTEWLWMITDQERYSATAMFLHWVMAILVITLFCLGWYMVDLPKGSDERSWFFALHKSIGLWPLILWPSFYSRKGNFLTSFVSDQCLPNPK